MMIQLTRNWITHSARTICFTGFAIAVVIIGCVSYDKPIIYHKNFQPGTHPLLRFDGYYSTVPVGYTAKERPVFLYRDGSAWFAEEDIDANSITALACIGDRASAKHSWGNYKIEGDTIFLERFTSETTTGNYNRIILTGIVAADKIHWLLRTFHRSTPDSVNYDMNFITFSCKPDSTKNWTRTLPLYNK